MSIPSGTIKAALAAVTLGGAAAGINTCLFNVNGGERGVIYDKFRGVLPSVYSEGTHFRIPFIQDPIIYDVRIRPHVMSSITGTRDLQNVNISLRVLCRPEIARLPKIYQSLGIDFDERVLPSIGNEVLKSVVAHFNAEQLLTDRAHVSKDIRDSLTSRANDFGILVDDVSITHLSFSREFSSAIEAKQVAQQDAERSKFIVMRSEQEKRAAVIRAEGESESANLINDALKQSGTGLVEIRRIETATDIAKRLARGNNITYLPNSGMLLNLPVAH